MKTEFQRTGRINLTATSQKELDQRIADLEKRGWTLKQVIPPEEKHFSDFSIGPRNKRTIVRTGPGFAKYRAVMVPRS
ncbi:hypothetical protein HU147_18615 [Planomicrobium chinense]|uniref:hypothetical protein n=1 Tax=Planococcus chinensis TaxID=272917 RepID=UPI001CC5749B|nr:hypothetical protein [Planococcus chinensis]MBZ5203220.1 hypothetical protein [Planococcus chinensis]